MLRIVVALASTLVGFAVPTLGGDQITYLSCRADNDDEASIFGLNYTAQKVCDRSVEGTWFSPSVFDAARVTWNDGLSTKTIYRTGDKRYEHDFLLLVNHIGNCDKVQPSPAQKCNPP